MTKEMNKSIERLRELAPKLNQLTDQATNTIVRFEKFLNHECSIGVAAAVRLPEENERVDRYLAYRRLNGSYRVTFMLIWKGGEEPDDVIDHKPLAECPRDIKLECIENLPCLLEKVVTATAALIGGAGEASDKISEVLDALETVPR